MSARLTRSLYRMLLHSAGQLRHRPEGLRVRELLPVDSEISISLKGAHDAAQATRASLLHALPSVLPSTLPFGELTFDRASLSTCIRENFRAKRALDPECEEADEAVDTALGAIRLLREQTALEECSSRAQSPHVEVEGTSLFEAEEDVEVGGYQFKYRVGIRNTGTAKVKFRGVKITVHDADGNTAVRAGLSQPSLTGRIATVRKGNNTILLPGDCLQFSHSTSIPTREGFIQGTCHMQLVRPGRCARAADRFELAIPPFRLRAPRAREQADGYSAREDVQ
eukprot:CAMPEP_0177758126 /NCGR_PEP_ID=MMETSP0491_2-20121128/4021_1 /TAXON_ID=63592 /ORGANISM="Tetraselmis chuii, Strain PLY429" /LENGTH=281 /DNA_ID=CAMNT_0019273845 /DNA_START=538 /DNA_END=1383 /DNA_ORIENTATION=-